MWIDWEILILQITEIFSFFTLEKISIISIIVIIYNRKKKRSICWQEQKAPPTTRLKIEKLWKKKRIILNVHLKIKVYDRLTSVMRYNIDRFRRNRQEIFEWIILCMNKTENNSSIQLINDEEVAQSYYKSFCQNKITQMHTHRHIQREKKSIKQMLNIHQTMKSKS